jgi:predicted Fe-S protein YdhL (DUF1289 family)
VGDSGFGIWDSQKPTANLIESRIPNLVSSAMNSQTAHAILSPCIGICHLGADGLCDGCLRSGDEIARWMAMGDPERRRIMDEVLPERETMRKSPRHSTSTMRGDCAARRARWTIRRLRPAGISKSFPT